MSEIAQLRREVVVASKKQFEKQKLGKTLLVIKH